VLTGVMVPSGRAFVGSSNGSVTAISESTGKTLWSVGTWSAISAPPILADGDGTVGNPVGSVSCFGQTSGDLVSTRPSSPTPITGATSTLGIVLRNDDLDLPWSEGVQGAGGVPQWR
jgi:outer membrane protein assembly factor BamB